MIKIHMKKKKETKGTYVYEEVNADGSERDFTQCAIPSLYVRKTALSKAPQRISVTVKVEA